MSLRPYQDKVPPPLLGEMFRPVNSFKTPVKPPTAVNSFKVVPSLAPPVNIVNYSTCPPKVIDPDSATSPLNRHFGAPSKVLPVNKAPAKSRNPPKCSVCKGLVKGHSGPIGKGKCTHGESITSYVETVDLAPGQSRGDCITPPPSVEEELSTFPLSAEENNQLLENSVFHRPTLLSALDEISDLLDVSDNEAIETPNTLDMASVSSDSTAAETYVAKSTKQPFDKKGVTKRKKQYPTKKQNPTKKQKTGGLKFFSGFMKNIYASDDLLDNFEMGKKKSFNSIQPRANPRPQTYSPDHQPTPVNDNPDHQSPLLINDQNHPIDHFRPEDHFLDTFSPEDQFPVTISPEHYSLNTINPEDHSQDAISPVIKLPNPSYLFRRSSSPAQHTEPVPSTLNPKKSDDDDVFDFSDHEGALEGIEVEAPAPAKGRKVPRNLRVPKPGRYWDSLKTRPDNSQDTIRSEDHSRDEFRPENIHLSDYPTCGKDDHTSIDHCSSRTHGNVTNRSGKRPARKCKDKNCETCIIEKNCGLCECCLNPGLKLKCFMR